MIMQDRFAEMWRRSRDDSGLTQREVAQRLGVSRTTIQNWESGYSCPTQLEGFQWFRALGLQPFPYYLALLYPEFDGINADVDDQQINDALCRVIHDLPADSKRKLLYVLYGDHGSSPMAVLELITAHLQTPLRARLNVAETVRTNYEMAEAQDMLSRPEHIQPNVSLLNAAYDSAKTAVKQGRGAYTAIEEET